MVEILQNKNAATRFQIMVEIAASGPGIQQKTIAAKLGVTPQAISDYIHQLLTEGLVISTGRSQYRVSTEGVNWMLSVLREMHAYSAMVEKAVTNIAVSAAIAETDISEGQAVGIKMKSGLLYAGSPSKGARGIAVSSVEAGEDVGIANIEGLVDFTRGKIMVIQVPVIQKGGSARIKPDMLKKYVSDANRTGAIGIESIVTLRKIGIEPNYSYGVTEAAIEAAKCGLSFTIVCTDDAVPGLIKRLQEEEIEYVQVDARKKTGRG
jgi:putative transcriptional regulator